jgi:hypothetical protein
MRNEPNKTLYAVFFWDPNLDVSYLYRTDDKDQAIQNAMTTVASKPHLEGMILIQGPDDGEKGGGYLNPPDGQWSEQGVIWSGNS